MDDGDILTSAGSAAGIELYSHIVRKDFGAAVANAVAHRLVASPHREGGQAQFIDGPVGEEANPWLSRLLQWRQHQLHPPILASELAEQARMSKRTLARRFAQTTGNSPLQWITKLRVRRAKDRLETTSLSVDEIAERCGFGSAPTLWHHFRSQVRLAPTTYRSHFRRSGKAAICPIDVA